MQKEIKKIKEIKGVDNSMEKELLFKDDNIENVDIMVSLDTLKNNILEDPKNDVAEIIEFQDLNTKIDKYIQFKALKVVKENGLGLSNIFKRLQTEEICLEAVKQNGLAIAYVREDLVDEKMCLEAVKQNGLALQYISKQTMDICVEAIKQNPNATRYAKVDTVTV